MICVKSFTSAFVAGLLVVFTITAGAQGQVAVNSVEARGPRFFLAQASRDASPVPLDVGRTPVLVRRIAVDLDGVPLKEALAEISARSGLTLVYGDGVLPADKRVHLRAEQITVVAALTDVLADIGVDVLFNSRGGATLVRRTVLQRVLAGVITGRITDAVTSEGISGVQVYVEGSRSRSSSDASGRYRLSDIPSGTHTLAARRLGYAPTTSTVTVPQGEDLTVDFSMRPTASSLSEVVVTATGEQRRVELGHVVARINADSVVKAASVGSLSELLNGRVAGLQVNTFQGTVGGEISLQLRGPSTIQLSTEPIIIVDGIRFTGRAAGRVFLGSVNNVEPTSPLNDLNPNEIESIEIAKGPSAATLYGTDAANGVIVITTKRGRPGPARWNAYMKGAVSDIPKTDYPEAYWGWQTSGGVTSPFSCLLQRVATGGCTQDSVTVIGNPLNDPDLTIFASKPRWEYGANVSGGSQNFRYFFGGNLEQVTGPLRMPPAMADSISLERQVLTEQLEPNAFSKVNLHSNVAVRFGGSTELQVNAGYTRRATRTLNLANPYMTSITFPAPGDPFSRGNGPDQRFSSTSTEQVSRTFASMTGRWSTSWLSARAVGGVDLANITRSSLAGRGEAPALFDRGAVGDDRGRQLATTGELTATASFASGRLSSRTSVATQYVRTVDDVLSSSGTDLPPGASTIGAAASVQVRQSYREQVTLGSYLEQTVGLNDRLFLTGAMRVDGASTFGRDYDAVIYPKVGISWLASEEPILSRLPLLDDLRLRYAFGASGQQPRPEWARPGFALQQVFYQGAITNVYTINTLGNPNLRPEQVREHEFGFDASALDNRVEVGLTWYRRKTVDQIISANLPPGLGTMETNLGLTTGRGFEAQISARPLNTRAVSWSISFLHSFHRTTLQDLGGAAARRAVFGGWVEGYPLGARFVRPLVGYEDTNGDGIINQFGGELQFGDTMVYAGESRPPRSQSLTNSVNFFDARLRFSALLERRSGFTQLNSLYGGQCANSRCRALVDRTTPLAEQAAAGARNVRGDYDFIEPGDFTRLREVGIAIDLPPLMTRALQLSSGTLSLQGRNLALWTSYSGADPESSTIGSLGASALGIPQGRTWALRFDIGF